MSRDILNFFTKCLITQNLADVKSFFEIIFNYLMMKREAAMLREELDTTYYRMYVYPRTLKGASTVEFVKTNRKFKEMYTDLEAIDDCVEEIEAAFEEAHLLGFVNTFFENFLLTAKSEPRSTTISMGRSNLRPLLFRRCVV